MLIGRRVGVAGLLAAAGGVVEPVILIGAAARLGIADVEAAILVRIHPGIADGHQLVAEDGVAHLLPLGDLIPLLVGADTRETVHHHARLVGEVAVGLELEVAQPGEGEGLELVGVLAVKIQGLALVAQQEEAVAVQHQVGGLAGDAVVAGAHIDIHRPHSGAVADLGGILAAGHGGAVGAAGQSGVQGGLENGPPGLIAVGVDVRHVVADDVQVLHMSPQACDGRIHCTSHSEIINSFRFDAARPVSNGHRPKASEKSVLPSVYHITGRRRRQY